MAQEVSIGKEVEEAFKKLRFSRADHNIGMILKINKDAMALEIEYNYTEPDTTLEAIKEDLEDQNPRFILFSYKWQLGDRVNFPIIFIYFSPEGSSPYLNMLYSRLKPILSNKLNIQRQYEVRELDEEDVLTEAWLLERLKGAK
ncbi:Gmfb [Acrasis kona]|uniref:Gmfb n=1 Tax=Acrasis kona TaxID=1008807 RepID=A0AAW2YR11_9EUKA